MNEEEYISVQSQLLLIGRLVQEMDLPAFLAAIHRAETLAPILDPTLLMRGEKNLTHIRNLAEALQPFRRAVLQVVEEEIGEVS